MNNALITTWECLPKQQRAPLWQPLMLALSKHHVSGEIKLTTRPATNLSVSNLQKLMKGLLCMPQCSKRAVVRSTATTTPATKRLYFLAMVNVKLPVWQHSSVSYTMSITQSDTVDSYTSVTSASYTAIKYNVVLVQCSLIPRLFKTAWV